MRDGGGSQELIDRLRQQVGRLDIVPEELAGRNQRSALFKTMFLAFREAGAKDWRSQVAIALDHSGSHHRLQFHHILPKAVLKAEYTGREADDIANLCFIGGKTNRQISDKPPERYLPEMIAKSGSAALDAQCIPTETALLGTTNACEAEHSEIRGGNRQVLTGSSNFPQVDFWIFVGGGTPFQT